MSSTTLRPREPTSEATLISRGDCPVKRSRLRDTLMPKQRASWERDLGESEVVSKAPAKRLD